MATSVKTSQVETKTETSTTIPEPAPPPAPPEPQRPAPGARRAGYLAIILITAALLTVIDFYPGWQAAPFVTVAAASLIGLINVALVAPLVINFVYMAYDPPWLRLAGDLVCAILGLIAGIRIWQVFPFLFHPAQPWVSLARVVLVLVIVGTFAAIVVNIAKLVRIIIHQP